MKNKMIINGPDEIKRKKTKKETKKNKREKKKKTSIHIILKKIWKNPKQKKKKLTPYKGIFYRYPRNNLNSFYYIFTHYVFMFAIGLSILKFIAFAFLL